MYIIKPCNILKYKKRLHKVYVLRHGVRHLQFFLTKLVTSPDKMNMAELVYVDLKEKKILPDALH